MSQATKDNKIVISPVTRVEGHGKVTIKMDKSGKVDYARFHIVEFRGFERFALGRFYWEMPVLIQRLCGICPVSHHLCAAKATDLIVGVDKIPVTAEKMRRLMHYGQTFQSHVLHFFHLCSPDFLFGFEADPAVRNVIGVAQKHPDLAKMAILMRKYGQEVIKATSGKKIHGTGAIPGGINKNLTIEERDFLKKDVDQMVQWSIDGLELFKKIFKEQIKYLSDFAAFPSNHLCLQRKDGCMDIYDGVLRAKDAEGKIIFDGVEPKDYLEYIAEEVRPWSYMKFPFIKQLGMEKGWYRVGPLARVNNCDFIDTPLAEKERQGMMALTDGKPNNSSLAYHYARLIEILHSAEKIKELLDDKDLQGKELVKDGKHRNEGIAILEAPRGTLFHHYRVGDTDQVTMANLIVSTTNNNEPMNKAVEWVARNELQGQKITEGLLNHVEVAIRAYDPCLSCATHAVGQMPLVIELESSEGELVDQRVRE